jgi:hypothetical protein
MQQRPFHSYLFFQKVQKVHFDSNRFPQMSKSSSTNQTINQPLAKKKIHSKPGEGF